MPMTRMPGAGWPRSVRIAVLAILLLLVADLIFLAVKWPFGSERVLRSLGGATGSTVQIKSHRTELLPWPGCTLDGVVFRVPGGRTMATASRISVRGAWTDLLFFRRRVDEVRVEELNVDLDAAGARRRTAKGEQTVIEEIVADGSSVQVAPGLSVVLRRMRLMEIGPGRLSAVEGRFDIPAGELGGVEGIAGTLRAGGDFSGPLEEIRAQGSAAIENFDVNRDGNPVELRAAYRVAVNAKNRDVRLESVDAEFLRTKLAAKGDIRRGHVELSVAGDRVRVEDLLRLFTRSPQPALSGPMTLRAQVELPPGDERFLSRLRLDGNAAIQDARWSKPRTQAKINELSARARGNDKEDSVQVVSDLSGSVAVRDGVARLQGVSFRVPGASAKASGTFNLLTKDVNLQGTVSMAADVSEATSGIKSVLLKPFSFLFRRKKDKRGAVLPVSVTGRYPRPRYRVGLTR